MTRFYRVYPQFLFNAVKTTVTAATLAEKEITLDGMVTCQSLQCFFLSSILYLGVLLFTFDVTVYIQLRKVRNCQSCRVSIQKSAHYHLSLVMRKPAFCICEHERRRSASLISAFVFRYIDSTIPLLPKIQNFNAPAISCDCTARFVLGKVKNSKDRFSHNEAHLISALKGRLLFN